MAGRDAVPPNHRFFYIGLATDCDGATPSSVLVEPNNCGFTREIVRRVANEELVYVIYPAYDEGVNDGAPHDCGFIHRVDDGG